MAVIQGIIWGTAIWVIKRDTRSLGNDSHEGFNEDFSLEALGKNRRVKMVLFRDYMEDNLNKLYSLQGSFSAFSRFHKGQRVSSKC